MQLLIKRVKGLWSRLRQCQVIKCGTCVPMSGMQLQDTSVACFAIGQQKHMNIYRSSFVHRSSVEQLNLQSKPTLQGPFTSITCQEGTMSVPLFPFTIFKASANDPMPAGFPVCLTKSHAALICKRHTLPSGILIARLRAGT